MGKHRAIALAATATITLLTNSLFALAADPGLEIKTSPSETVSEIVSGDVNGEQAGVLVNADEGSKVEIEIDGNVNSTGATASDADNLLEHLADDPSKVPSGEGQSFGIYTAVEDGSEVNIHVTGDVIADGTSGSGVLIDLLGDNAKLDLVVEGTIKGTDAGIAFASEDLRVHDNDISITVWKIEGGEDGTKWFGFTDDARLVNDAGETVGKGRVPGADQVKLAEQLNYIIRIKDAEGASVKLQDKNRNDLNKESYGYAARKDDEIIVVITVDPNYELTDVKGGSVELIKNEDGTYSLKVPCGGGIEIETLLRVLRQNPPRRYDDPEDPDDPGTEDSTVVVGEVPIVLGATRDLEIIAPEAMVLGARRSAATNDAGYLLSAMLFGCAAAMAMADKRRLI